MSSLDLQLAEHAASVRFENLSAAAIERAKIFTLDTIGVGLAGEAPLKSRRYFRLFKSGVIRSKLACGVRVAN